MWFSFQDGFSYTSNSLANHVRYHILKSILNIFSLFMVQFEYKFFDTTGVWIQCNNSNKFQISKTLEKYILPVFIKAVMFHHVGIYWMIETREQDELSVDLKR